MSRSGGPVCRRLTATRSFDTGARFVKTLAEYRLTDDRKANPDNWLG